MSDFVACFRFFDSKPTTSSRIFFDKATRGTVRLDFVDNAGNCIALLKLCSRGKIWSYASADKLPKVTISIFLCACDEGKESMVFNLEMK